MAKALAELLDEGVTGRYVLVRSDLNVPLKDGVVTDDGRVRASLPVIEKLAKAGARVIVTAHLGRPKGQVDPQYSIAPAAARLAELASVPVKVAADLVGEDAKAKAADLKDGEVLVLVRTMQSVVHLQTSSLLSPVKMAHMWMTHSALFTASMRQFTM